MDHSREHVLLEGRLRAAARALPYPPTPTLDAATGRRAKQGAQPRRLTLARLTLLLVLLLGAMLVVPEVRAAAMRLLQLGAVRVLLDPSADPGLISTAAPPAGSPFALDLPGRTTLADAERTLSFPVRLPAYPPDLGAPDLVYTQDLGGDALVLVWRDRANPARASLLLMTLASQSFAEKVLHDPEQTIILDEALVGDARALWVRGPHLFQAGRGELVLRRVVQGNTLVWTEGALTYRLETDGTLEEALRIAASLENR